MMMSFSFSLAILATMASSSWTWNNGQISTRKIETRFPNPSASSEVYYNHGFEIKSSKYKETSFRTRANIINKTTATKIYTKIKWFKRARKWLPMFLNLAPVACLCWIFLLRPSRVYTDPGHKKINGLSYGHNILLAPHHKLRKFEDSNTSSPLAILKFRNQAVWQDVSSSYTWPLVKINRLVRLWS